MSVPSSSAVTSSQVDCLLWKAVRSLSRELADAIVAAELADGGHLLAYTRTDPTELGLEEFDGRVIQNKTGICYSFQRGQCAANPCPAGRDHCCIGCGKANVQYESCRCIDNVISG